MILNTRNIPSHKFEELLNDSKNNFPLLLKNEYNAREIAADSDGWRQFRFKDQETYVLFLFRYV